jgi:cobalamin biosynthesis Mg chelatase CobN
MAIDDIERLRTFHSIEMANLELAKERFETIKRVLPDVVMIEDGIHQYFIRTNEGNEELERKGAYLVTQRQRLEKELEGKKQAIRQITGYILPKRDIEYKRSMLQDGINTLLDEYNALSAFETDMVPVVLLIMQRTRDITDDLRRLQEDLEALPKADANG